MKHLATASLGAMLAAFPAAAQDAPTVDVVHWLTAGAESEAMDVLAGEIEARGGTWVDSAAPGGGADANALMMSRIAGGNPPGVAFTALGPNALELAEAGVLRDVRDLAENSGLDAVAPVMVEISTGADGGLYSLPIGLETQNFLWYSPQVLEAAGVELPATWDEFLESAEAIEAAGFIPMAVGAQGWQLGILFSSVVVGAGGADLYRSAIMEHDAEAARGPEMVRAFEVMRALADLSDPGAANRAWNDTLNLVAQGEAAMQVMGSWAGAELENMGLEQGAAWDCALTPGAEAVVVEGAGFMFPTVESEAERAGQALFVEVLMDPAVQTEFARVKGAVPPRADADTGALGECAQIAADALAEGGGLATISASVSQDGWGQVQDLLASFWADPSTTPDAAAEGLAAILEAEG